MNRSVAVILFLLACLAPAHEDDGDSGRDLPSDPLGALEAQVDQLEAIAKALEDAYPDAAAEAKDEEGMETCLIALELGGGDGLVECVEMATRKDVDIWDLTAVVQFLRDQAPEAMARLPDRDWQEQIRTARTTRELQATVLAAPAP
jgi:hypothetical protein